MSAQMARKPLSMPLMAASEMAVGLVWFDGKVVEAA